MSTYVIAETGTNTPSTFTTKNTPAVGHVVIDGVRIKTYNKAILSDKLLPASNLHARLLDWYEYSPNHNVTKT